MTTTRLSSDLITEVLSRLPPKSLLRFRCASKSLCSEIDGSEFSNLHLRRSIERASHQALAFNITGQVQLFEHLPDFPVKLSSATDLTPQVRFLSATPFSFIGQSRGLIALALESGPRVVIWNPSTMKRWIPTVPDDGDSRKSSFGFGYDSVTDDYKLVRVHRWLQDNLLDFKVSVYSFKSNHWRPITNSPNPFHGGRSLGQHGVIAHEAVHFVTVRYLMAHEFHDEFLDEFEVYIKAFDLHTEKFQDLVVKLPSHEGGGLIGLDVTVLGGHFSIVRFGGGEMEAGTTEMEAWVLKDYEGNEESWTKLFRVSLPWFQIDETKSLLESGNRFLMHYTRGRFAWIDLETMSVEEVKVEANQAIQEATLLVASFESLGKEEESSKTWLVTTLSQG